MGRPAKYRNADDIINNCTIKETCFIWNSDKLPSPLISPMSPISKVMGTNSVARILFALCRHIPASTRMVKWCNTPYCVNPYHHTETREIVKRRLRAEENLMGSGRELLPEQEAHRHLLPSDADLLPLKPRDPYVNEMLRASSELAGFDARNLAQNRLIAKGVPTAQEGKPVLVMKALVEKQKREAEAQANPRKEETEEDWDAFTSDFFKALGKANTAP
jgi:hypothetical protein